MSPLVLSPLLAFGLASAVASVSTDLDGGPRLQGPQLTPTELQDCLAQREELAELGSELLRQQVALQLERDELVRLSEALHARSATLDARSSPEAVAAFHEAVRQRDARIEAHVAHLPVFHAQVEAVKGEEAAWTARCADRPYVVPGQEPLP